MADENESTIADAAGPTGPESPVKGPAGVPAMFDRLKFETQDRHIFYPDGPIPGHLYLMRAREFVKIGIASDPRKRLKSIQVGCPLIVTLARAWRFADGYYALLSEKAAHETLRPFLAQGEWFAIDEDKAIAVLEEIVAAAAKLNDRHSATARRTEIVEVTA